MAETTRRYRVFVSSPSDVLHLREAVEDMLARIRRSLDNQAIPVDPYPVRYEYLAGRTNHERLLRDGVRNADVFVMILGHQYGTAAFSSAGDSGTVEEYGWAIERRRETAARQGEEHPTPEIVAYFPADLDDEQYRQDPDAAQIRAFRNRVQADGVFTVSYEHDQHFHDHVHDRLTEEFLRIAQQAQGPEDEQRRPDRARRKRRLSSKWAILIGVVLLVIGGAVVAATRLTRGSSATAATALIGKTAPGSSGIGNNASAPENLPFSTGARSPSELIQRGRNVLNAQPQHLDRALQLFADAIARNPNPNDRARAYLYRAIIFEQQANYQAALRAIEQAITVEQGASPADTNLVYREDARILGDTNDLRDALAAIKRAIQVAPRDTNDLTELAYLLINNREPAAGLTQAIAAEQADLSYASAFTEEADARIALGQPAMALTAAHTAITLGGDRERPYASQGRIQLAAGDYPAALTSFEQAVQRNRRSVDAQVGLGDTLTKLGRYREAAAAYTAADDAFGPSRRYNPRYVTPWIDLAEALFNTTHWRSAAQPLAQALHADPKNAVVLNERGYLNFRLHQVRAALSDFAAAAKYDPGWAVPYRNQGSVFLYLHQPSKALPYAALAVQKAPTYVDALWDEAAALVSLHRGAEALPLLVNASSLDLTNAALHRDLAARLTNSHRALDALPEYQQAVSHDPKNVDYHFQLGYWGYWSLGQNPAALHELDTAIQGSRHINPAYYEGRARVLLDTSQPGAALADIRKALSVKPRSAPLIAQEGTALAALHRRKEALHAFNAALTIDHADETALEGLAVDVSDHQPALRSALHLLNLALATPHLTPVKRAALLSTRGDAYGNAHLYYLALGSFQQAAHLDPSSGLYLSDEGDSYTALVEGPQALSAYQQAAQLWPDRPYAIGREAQWLLYFGRSGEARIAAVQALALNPQNSDGLYVLQATGT